jgi:hypothetical protein
MPIWSTTKTFTRITINGQSYSSVEEMPPDVRRQYDEMMSKLTVDKNNNGIPDVFEGAVGDQPARTIIHKQVKATTLLNGTPADPGGSGTIQLRLPTLPTLLALLATAAAIAGWVVWLALRVK